MASMRIIKRRVRSVGSIQQITKAMNLVSTSRLQRARSELEKNRPYYMETRRVVASIVGSSKNIRNEFLEEREVKNTHVIVLACDRGLCGSYNSNVAKEAHTLIKSKANVDLVTVGSKSRDYFIRRGKKPSKSYIGISEKPNYEDAAEIGAKAIQLFRSADVDEVYLVYTEFKSTISYVTKTVRILPVDVSEFATADSETSKALMNYEPEEEEVLSMVIPKYINTIIYGAMLEAAACEQGARMTSMDSATDNADDMISKLTLMYNRARQGAITQELNEIVGGANALE